MGVYSIGARIASAMVLLLAPSGVGLRSPTRSRTTTAPGVRTRSCLTYLLFVASWAALALALLSPWLVRWLTTPAFFDASEVVPLLVFGAVALGGFNVVSIVLGPEETYAVQLGRHRERRGVSVVLNLVLIPPYGIVGAGIANLSAFTVMFLVITWWSQRVFWVPYQWRRVVTVVGVAVGLTVLGKAVDVPLAAAIALVAVYPLVLWPLRFYLPTELAAIRQRAARTAVK